MAYVDPATVQVPTVGEPLAAGWCSAVRDSLEHVARTPGIVVTRPISQPIPQGAWASVEFSRVLRDTHGYRTDRTVITVPSGVDGWYTVTGRVRWGNATGRRLMALDHNSERIWMDRNNAETSDFAHSATLPDTFLAAGDVIGLALYHSSSGGDLAITEAHLSVRLVALP